MIGVVELVGWLYSIVLRSLTAPVLVFLMRQRRLMLALTGAVKE